MQKSAFCITLYYVNIATEWWVANRKFQKGDLPTGGGRKLEGDEKKNRRATEPVGDDFLTYFSCR